LEFPRCVVEVAVSARRSTDRGRCVTGAHTPRVLRIRGCQFVVTYVPAQPPFFRRPGSTALAVGPTKGVRRLGVRSCCCSQIQNQRWWEPARSSNRLECDRYPRRPTSAVADTARAERCCTHATLLVRSWLCPHSIQCAVASQLKGRKRLAAVSQGVRKVVGSGVPFALASAIPEGVNPANSGLGDQCRTSRPYAWPTATSSPR
jgi:hypothetical protein